MSEVKFYFSMPKETIAQSNRGRELGKKAVQLPYSSFQAETRNNELKLVTLQPQAAKSQATEPATGTFASNRLQDGNQ